MGATLADGEAALLRAARPGDRRWVLLRTNVISLREEDARRYNLDDD